MITHTKIDLRAAKDPARRIVLNYRLMPLVNTQARLTGRYALAPDLDLSDYSSRAVIDWVMVSFKFVHPTQF